MTAADLRPQLQLALGSAYVVERELGGGGMSRVFVATDTRLGRRVVVKVLSPDLVASVSAERFEREIRLAARLQHPHIVPLLSAGDVGGIPYYTMPFVEGASLRDRLSTGPLPYAEAQSILRDVARALAYAHRQGIVHRDIKPENVLLAEGVAMVADFGVARALSAAATLAGGDVLTQVGMQIGTPAYMAPEQAAGDPDVDFRADLYAFGVMAYELLAGQHPFAGKRSMHALVAAHLTEQPQPLATHTREVAIPVTVIVMQCLGKAPEERPESASAIVRAFDGLSAPNVTPPAPAAPPAPIAPSIAVLPFTNMSGNPENEYFSDGITDDVIVALTQVKGLKVAARTSSFAFKGKNAELATIGSTLGVRTVLQGSVRHAGNRVRVTVQLMSVDGVQLWSDRYDRNLDDIFAIQDEIARGIVEQLQVTLGLKDATVPLVAPPTVDLEAYQLYLRGREAAYLRSPSSLRRAIQYFRQALARDADFARAHVGLAEAYIGLGVYQYIPTIEADREARAALEAAERLQPDLALVHVLWGQLKLYLRPDWHEAGAHLDRALAIDPNEPLAHAYVAFLNGMLGNLEASKAAAARAVAADPLSLFIRAVSVMGFPVRGIPGADSAAALEAHETALAMDPNAVIHLWMAGVRLADFDRHHEAVERIRRAVELTQRGPLMVGIYARALGLAGRRDEALAARAELRTRAQREYVGPAARLMMVGLDLDDEESTAALLQENIDAMTGPTAIVTTVARELEPLLDHPRLGGLVRKLTLWATRPPAGWSS
jgi:serine/threonine-protein kinase